MRIVWRIAVFGQMTLLAGSIAAKPVKVSQWPEQPRSGEVVHVIASGEALVNQPRVSLQYQLLEPGRYIELKEPAYRRNWVSLPMNDDGRDGDAVKGDGTFSVLLPADLQKHRRLVRYRIAIGNRIVAPEPEDTQPNFAYFVYDGVPAWRAAIDPASRNPVLRTPMTFSAELMRSVQVYQFIAKKSSVENTTWYQPTGFGNFDARHRYNHTCTIAAGGKVYDHVRFRARGGQWRYAMGKNMWKFDFPRGHHLKAVDDFGQPYPVKWEKLNLGACIQQADFHRRGEHGLYEALTYRLFNLAGVPAPRTHYVHLRIIDEPEESPRSQYKGDFWGLYLATEEIDDHFLDAHGLPDGNLYKWDFGQPKPEHLAAGAPANREDVFRFVASYQRGASESWWRKNVDLPCYYSYRSILECVHHYDIGMNKNYFYYHQPHSGRWMVFPWDVDLTWKNTMFGSGLEPFWRAGLLRQPHLNIEFQNRLREIRDLLFNREQAGALIDQYAAVIADPGGGPSFVDADRAKWDYHPIMVSRYVYPSKAGHGQFYLQSPTKDFRGMVQLMKDYIRIRGDWCDRVLLTGPPVLISITVAPDGELDFKQPTLRFRALIAPSTEPIPTIEWRLAEVSLGPVTKPPRPRKYEIESLWQSEGALTAEIPSTLLERGHTYRVRARVRDGTGRCTHWSEPAEFTIGN